MSGTVAPTKLAEEPRCALPVLCWGGVRAPGNIYPRSLRPGFFLSCGSSATKAQRNSRRWETARRRVSHQRLVASALLRVARFVLGRSGSLGQGRRETRRYSGHNATCGR
jgi:hypothetical protein